MSVRGAIAVTVTLTVLLPDAPLGDETTCVITDLRGVDEATETAVRDQLESELGVPIDPAAPVGCASLHITFSNQQVVIRLTGAPPVHTALYLDNVPPRHWPRAVALSVAGLLARRTALSDTAVKETDVTPEAGTDAPASSASRNNAAAPSQKMAANKMSKQTGKATDAPTSRSDRSTETPPHSASISLTLGLRLGGRFMPRFPAWGEDAAAGVHVAFHTVVFSVWAIGLFGRRTVRLGQVFTTGGGVDLSLDWRAIDRKRLHLGLGPAVEALAVYGFGKETTFATSDNLLAPAVTVRLQVGLGIDITSRTRLLFSFGGGYHVLGVTLQANHRDTAGLAGGYMTMTAGVDFSLRLLSAH